MTDAPLLRSALYMPGSNARAIAKARALPVDAIVLDLEDSVAPEAKADARAQIVAAFNDGGFGPRYRVARINAHDGVWGRADLAALAQAPLDAVLAPKIDDAADVRDLADAMAGAGFADDVALWIMVETPLAVLNLAQIAACAADTPLAGMVLGLNDLAKDSGIAQLPGRAAFQPVLTMAVLAARAHGLIVLDGVCNALDDEDRLHAECRQARDGGFDGKTLIHPRQIATANAIFAPSPDEIAEAEAIVAAFDDPAHAGRGAIRVDGKMVERLHLAQAEVLLARARRIAARPQDPPAEGQAQGRN